MPVPAGCFITATTLHDRIIPGRLCFGTVAHADLNYLYKNRIVLYGDMNLFTDREAGNTLNPTEFN